MESRWLVGKNETKSTQMYAFVSDLDTLYKMENVFLIGMHAIFACKAAHKDAF